MSDLVSPDLPANALYAGLALKALGPVADRFGDFLKSAPERLGSFCRRVIAKVREPAAAANYGVPIRVAKEAIDAALYSDDAVHLEYLAGVVASSRSLDSRDDRVMPLLNLVRTTSAATLRFHYAAYSAFRRLIVRPNCDIGNANVANQCFVGLSISDFRRAMALADDANVDGLATYVMSEGVNLALFGELSTYGDETHGRRSGELRELANGGFLLTPTLRGAALYLVAAGVGIDSVSRIFDRSLEVPALDGVALPDVGSLFGRVSTMAIAELGGTVRLR